MRREVSPISGMRVEFSQVFPIVVGICFMVVQVRARPPLVSAYTGTADE